MRKNIIIQYVDDRPEPINQLLVNNYGKQNVIVSKTLEEALKDYSTKIDVVLSDGRLNASYTGLDYYNKIIGIGFKGVFILCSGDHILLSEAEKLGIMTIPKSMFNLMEFDFITTFSEMIN